MSGRGFCCSCCGVWTIVVRVGPPSSAAEGGEQQQHKNDAADADAGLFGFKERIEIGEGFACDRSWPSGVSGAFCVGLVQSWKRRTGTRGWLVERAGSGACRARSCVIFRGCFALQCALCFGADGAGCARWTPRFERCTAHSTVAKVFRIVFTAVRTNHNFLRFRKSNPWRIPFAAVLECRDSFLLWARKPTIANPPAPGISGRCLSAWHHG